MASSVDPKCDGGPSLQRDAHSTAQERSTIPILECKERYSYRIPSFSVLTVVLRRIKYELVLQNGEAKIVDGFIKEDPSLQRVYPAEVSIEENFDAACVVEAGELKRSIDIDGLTLVDDQVFIIWRWEWLDNDDVESDEESTTSITVIPETPHDSDSENEEDISSDLDPSLTIGFSPVITHTVTFKCIGCTKDASYQETLARVSQIRNNNADVICRLHPEPNNPVDALAIAFKVLLDERWHTIGYVVREALNEVHEALSEKKITAVSIDWVKYTIYWRSPGWYAGVKLTRIGEWSRIVVLSQSAKKC